jgi:small subunit ribosomal protein S4
MSRYTGPRVRVMRALGIDLPGLSSKSIQNRPHPPGQHGAQKANSRKSEFGLQLMEKQKLRFNYGLTEAQLRRVVISAKKQRGTTSGKIIELLERRLDNLVFRAGFAPTIPAARQMINHGHFALNGKRATIPSILVRIGDRIGPTEKGKNHNLVRSALAAPSLERPDWISFEATPQIAQLTRLPEIDAVPFPVDLQRVVEYYATRS